MKQAGTDDLDSMDFSEADDDVVQTFQLESSNLRGRIVRLGGVLNDILEPHAYPETVAHMVAETITLSALLSSMLKYEGIFTLQAQGDGPVSMVVSDMTSAGQLRGCANFDPERVEHGTEQLKGLSHTESAQNQLAQLLGKGHMAFTVDQGNAAERYQGIVDLKGASLIDCVQHYFNQSEQIGTGIKMAVGRRGDKWRAGAIMLQHMPEEEKNYAARTSHVREDDWRRAMILLDSCTEDEFLSPDLHSNILLTRIFHEEGIRVYTPRRLVKGCRCSQEKIERILAMMPEDDIDYMRVDGEIRIRCEFCGSDFVFDAAAIERKLKASRTESVSTRE